MAQKPHLNIVFIGHVDHGKSTTVGRLLLDTGYIRQEEIDKFRAEAEAKGKATFEFAWVMDDLKEERERGVTIDIAHRRFDTQKYYFTIIDAPGHRDFVKNMITGTSQADAAVLVCSAAEGVQEQTREHIFLSRTLGVAQLICAINKMDRQEVKYSEAKYNEVKDDLTKLLKNVGFKVDQQVVFVPISAFKDDNINKASPEHDLVQGADPAPGARQPEGPGEADRQAAPAADPGRLHDHGYRHRPRRTGRDREAQDRREDRLHARAESAAK